MAIAFQSSVNQTKDTQFNNRHCKSFCDFCGRWTDSLEYLGIVKSANGAVICRDCAEMCVEIIKERDDAKRKAK